MLTFESLFKIWSHLGFEETKNKFSFGPIGIVSLNLCMLHSHATLKKNGFECINKKVIPMMRKGYVLTGIVLVFGDKNKRISCVIPKKV